MNIVISCLNSKYVHSSPAPWYLLGGIKEYSSHNHNVKICEATVNEELKSVKERILRNNPDIIGLCCYIWNITEVYSLVSMLKKESKAVIVLGGPEVSYNADTVLQNNEVDYVISGEGELPFALLADMIQEGDFKEIIGVCYRKNGLPIIRDPYISNNHKPLFCIDDYINNLNGRIAYIETTRGCPYSCAFCLSGRCGKVNYFDLDTCFDNIIKLSNSSAKIIKFVDRTFNADKIHSKTILKFILKNYGESIPAGTCFHFEIAGDILDSETIDIFNSAPNRIFYLEIGMQSFNEKTLGAIRRKTDTAKLIKNIKSLTKIRNVHTHIDLIAGLPCEDINSFAKSFDIGFSLEADVMQLGFLKLLHGAEMRTDTKTFPCEFSDLPPYEVISTPWLDKSDISIIKACESSLERLCNSGRFRRTCNYLFGELKLEPFVTLTNFGLFTGTKSIPLYEYVDRIYLYFSQMCDIDKLRDNLLCDLFESVNMEKIPSLLRKDDKRLNVFKHYLESSEIHKKEMGIKRRIFLLYSEQCGAYVDYYPKQENKIKKIPFSLF